ncbi:MBL fold metallo-hydrolase, partial [Patulibacter sp. S7RM1-6]
LADGDEAAVSLDVARRAGVYPPDYRLAPCATDADLRGDGTVRVGTLELRVLATPGHAANHLAFLLEDDDRIDLLAGDAVFEGGRIALLPTHDCDLAATAATLRRLRALPLDGLFAGHREPIARDGRAHVEHANLVLDRMAVPPPLNPTEPLR